MTSLHSAMKAVKGAEAVKGGGDIFIETHRRRGHTYVLYPNTYFLITSLSSLNNYFGVKSITFTP
jgi:hypothetical protein